MSICCFLELSVLMVYNSPASNSFEKCSRMFYCFTKALYHSMRLEQLKRQQMKEEVPKGTCRLKDVFLKKYT